MEEQKKKKKIASKIVDIILGALIVLILGLQIDMFITKNNNYGIPSLFGYSFMEVLTDSMEGKEPDSFDAGEGVVIQKKDVNDVKAGEIIAFYSEAIGYCVSHRVIEIVESPEYAGAKGSFEVSPAFEYSLDSGTSWVSGGESVALEEGKTFLTRSKEDKEHTLAHTIPTFIGKHDMTFYTCGDNLNAEWYTKVTGKAVESTYRDNVPSKYYVGTVISQNINPGVVISGGSEIHKIILVVAGEAETITLSNYSGLDFHEAYSMLSSLGLQVSVLEETNSDFDPGQVLRTEPVAGSVVEVGSSVVIVYAKAPTSSTVPDLHGVTLEEARTLLEQEEINIGHIEGATDVIVLPESQQFIILTDPVAGITLPRRSSITLYVGTWEDVQRGGTPTPTPAQVNVMTTVSGQGTAEGGGAYDVNTTVTLTATPAEGYRFVRWLDPYNNVVTESNVYSFVVYDPDGDPLTATTINYTAVFEPVQYDPNMPPPG